MKKVIQLVGLSVLVVILPAASWYFLRSGLDYRLESMDKLGDYGQLPDTELFLSNGKTVQSKYLEGKMVIIHDFPDSNDTSMVMKFYRQFSKRTDVQFIMSDSELLRLKADRIANIWLLADNESNNAFLATAGIEEQASRNVVLVDVKGEIRNYYNLKAIEELQQLVEHTAFLLPITETDKPIMQREIEK